jgi:hypothetical protein
MPLVVEAAMDVPTLVAITRGPMVGVVAAAGPAKRGGILLAVWALQSQ